MAILADLTTDEMLARIAQLEGQNAKLRAQGKGKLTLKVSAKGAVSVYGMGRWPVTLYSEQWGRLLDSAEQIRSFIEANVDSLSVKGDGQAEA